MTTAQAELLRRCIAADRLYRSKLARGLDTENAFRGVEISASHNAVNPRTAQALYDLGLIDIVDLYRPGRPWAFLGSFQPS